MVKAIAGILFVLIIPVGVFLYPAAFSVMAGSVFYIVFGFMALIVAFVLGSLAWKRFFPKSFSKSGISIAPVQQTGHVGSPGVGSRLRIVNTDAGIHVEWARLDYAFILIALGFFGPGIILLYIRKPRNFSHDLPPLAIAAIAAFVLFISGLFFRTLWTYLWDRPSLQVTGGCIDFLAGKKSVKTLQTRQIHSLFIRGYTYSDSHGRSVPNYILAAQADTGDESLCISDSRAQIEQLRSAIALRMGIEARSSPQPSTPLGSPKTAMAAEVIEQAKTLKASGALIDAIKLVREHSEMGLREAKEYVELL
jgi:hypothetical protein